MTDNERKATAIRLRRLSLKALKAADAYDRVGLVDRAQSRRLIAEMLEAESVILFRQQQELFRDETQV